MQNIGALTKKDVCGFKTDRKQGIASYWLFCLTVQDSQTWFVCSEKQDRDSVLLPDVISLTENTKPLLRINSSQVKKSVLVPAVSERFQIAGTTNCAPVCIH